MALEQSDNNVIRSTRFYREREGDWRRLAELLARVERGGLATLTFEESLELSALYRAAINSLSLAREISLDRALLIYLESLCGRAYLAVYAPRATLAGTVSRFFMYGAPRAVRQSWPAILIAFALMMFGVWTGLELTRGDSQWYYSFMPGGLSGGRGPEASEEFLRSVLYDKSPTDLDSLSAFATSLFTHNTQVAIFSFSLGVMAGIPTGFLAFYNGTIIGTFFAIHEAKGLGLDLFAWLSIHGVTELSALIIAAGGGLLLGSAILFPGQHSRRTALRLAGRNATKLALVAALMLLVAGLLEGFARQLITDINARIIIGWGIGALWLAWFVFAGRGDETGPS